MQIISETLSINNPPQPVKLLNGEIDVLKEIHSITILTIRRYKMNMPNHVLGYLYKEFVNGYSQNINKRDLKQSNR